jgi:hypothetical protein
MFTEKELEIIKGYQGEVDAEKIIHYLQRKLMKSEDYDEFILELANKSWIFDGVSFGELHTFFDTEFDDMVEKEENAYKMYMKRASVEYFHQHFLKPEETKDMFQIEYEVKNVHKNCVLWKKFPQLRDYSFEYMQELIHLHITDQKIMVRDYFKKEIIPNIKMFKLDDEHRKRVKLGLKL